MIALKAEEKSTLKIVFIFPGLHMSGGIISNIELANRLKRLGHDVRIVYPFLLVNPRLRFYNIRSIYRNIKASSEAKNTLFQRIKPEIPFVRVLTLNQHFIPDADAVIATWWETAYYVNVYSRKKGQKFYFVRGYETWFGNEALVDKTYRFPLKIIVTSTYLKNLLQAKLGVSIAEVIPNGINYDLFYKTRTFPKKEHVKRVGMVYRNMPLKGMKDGFDAFKVVSGYCPNVRLVLFGSPPTEKIPENTEFHVYPSVDKLRDLYNSLDVFLSSSHQGEGFCNPPLEAMACGVACVLTNVGGVPDYAIPGKTALISDPHDVESLARNMILLLKDDDTRMAIAEAGYQHIQTFSWDLMASRLEQFLINNC